MCSYITHLLFANEASLRLFNVADTQAYFAGTLFPDIRHYMEVAKGETHFENVVISDLENLSDWEKGYKFHSLLDRVHAEYMRKTDPKKLSPKSRYIAYTLLEDIIFYDKAKGLLDLDKYLTKNYQKELDFNFDREKMYGYKKHVVDYFSGRPTIEIQLDLLYKTIPEVRVEGVLQQVSDHFKDINNDGVISDIWDFYKDYWDLV